MPKIKRLTVGTLQQAQHTYRHLQEAQNQLKLLVQDLLPIESDFDLMSDANSFLRSQEPIGRILDRHNIQIED